MTVQNPENQYSQQPQGQQPQDRATTIAQLVKTFSGRSRANDSDAEVSKVRKAVDDFIEASKVTDETLMADVRPITISSKTTGNFGVVVLTVQSLNTVTNQPAIYMAPLLVEKSHPNLEPQLVMYGNTQVEIPVTVNDVYTEEFVEMLGEEVASQYNNPSIQVIDCGYQIVNELTSLEIGEDIGRVILEAMASIDHAMYQVEKDAPVFTIGAIAGNPNIRIRSRVDLDAPRTTPNGLPVRADITTSLSIASAQTTKANIPVNREETLFEASAYVDLIYITQHQQQPMYPGYAPMPQPSYIPRIVINNLSVEMHNSALQFMLLGIASMASLARNNAYGVVWRNNFGQTQNPMRNFGAVGLQVPGLTEDGQPAILDVSGSTAELYNLMNVTLAPTPVFSIELDQGGQSTWVSRTFAEAATNSPKANQNLINAADKLTNGNFSKILAQTPMGLNAKLIEFNDDVIHTGYYNRNGEYHDLRELDLLAVLNTVGARDKEFVESYLMTLMPGAGSVTERLDARLRLLRSVFKDVKVKGYTRRYNFTAAFIEALTGAVAACGLVINNDNILSTGNQLTYTQNIQNWQNNMVNPSSVNPLFTHAQPAYQQAPNFGQLNGGWYYSQPWGQN